jgi:hypothetical protein
MSGLLQNQEDNGKHLTRRDLHQSCVHLLLPWVVAVLFPRGIFVYDASLADSSNETMKSTIWLRLSNSQYEMSRRMRERKDFNVDNAASLNSNQKRERTDRIFSLVNPFMSSRLLAAVLH